jgi:hypothetical protein
MYVTPEKYRVGVVCWYSILRYGIWGGCMYVQRVIYDFNIFSTVL